MTEPAPLSTAQRIKAARIEKGWTQRQLCDQVEGLTQNNLSRYERGTMKPTGGVVDKIMAVLGTSRILAAEDGALGIQGRAQGKLIGIDIMADPMPVDWIVEGFVARGFLTMIAGQPGAGKSMTTQTVAEALVTGKSHSLGMKLRHRVICEPCTSCGLDFDPEFGGMPHKEDGECWGTGAIERIDSRVMVLDAENAPNIVQQRAQDMGLTEHEAPRYIAAASDGFDIYKDRAILESMLADYRDNDQPVDLLVIDSWTSLWFGNENVVEQVMGCLKFLNELANRHKLGILLIHHTDKEGEDYRGSSAIAATIGGGVFAFSRFKENDGEDITARRMICTKMRIAAEPTFPKLYITGHGVDTEPDTSTDRIALAVAERHAKTTRVDDIDQELDD